MDFNLKRHRVLKAKNKLKNSELLLFFNSSKIKTEKWIGTEKKMKKLKLNYNQIFNKTTLKTLNNSIYKNINKMFSSVVILVKPNYKTMNLNIFKIKKELKKEFVLLLLKLNNKIYSSIQIKSLQTFSYKKNVLNFNNSLERCLKTTYKITQSKSK